MLGWVFGCGVMFSFPADELIIAYIHTCFFNVLGLRIHICGGIGWFCFGLICAGLGVMFSFQLIISSCGTMIYVTI